VLYLNLESEDFELQTRIASNLAGIRNDEYKEYSEERICEIQTQLSRYIVVVRDLKVSAKPSDLIKAVEEFRYKYGRYPGVLIVDYLNEVEPEKEGRSDTTYTSVKKNLKELMKLAARTKSALWTAVQFNREGLKLSQKGGGGKANATHMAESISVLFKATLVLSINLLHEASGEPDVAYLQIACDKYRFHNSRPEILAKIEYQFARLTELDEHETGAVLARIAASGPKPPTPVTQFAQLRNLVITVPEPA
jgi:hypothetical protein